jgi:tetraacyldisaccharide-1-P 4'-kinase
MGFSLAEMGKLNKGQKKYSDLESSSASVRYSDKLKAVFDSQTIDIHKTKAIGFAGIAHAASFESKLKENYHLVDFTAFGDHHEYTASDFKLIANSFEKNNSIEIVLTTEKDAARLQTLKAKKALGHLPLFYWPIQLEPDAELVTEIDNIIENKC